MMLNEAWRFHTTAGLPESHSIPLSASQPSLAVRDAHQNTPACADGLCVAHLTE